MSDGNFLCKKRRESNLLINIQMPRKMFLKDMLYLLFTFLVLLSFSFMGELNAIMCCIMVAMYIGYIILVVVMELRKKWKANEKGIEKPVNILSK